MSSTFLQTRRAVPGSARLWALGGGAALALGVAVALLAVVQPRPAAPVRPIDPPAVVVQPVERYTAEGTRANERRVESADEDYAVVEGPFGYEVVGRGSALPAIGDLVAVRLPTGQIGLAESADGYYTEGPQGYEWRPRDGR